MVPQIPAEEGEVWLYKASPSAFPKGWKWHRVRRGAVQLPAGAWWRSAACQQAFQLQAPRRAGFECHSRGAGPLQHLSPAWCTACAADLPLTAAAHCCCCCTWPQTLVKEALSGVNIVRHNHKWWLVGSAATGNGHGA